MSSVVSFINVCKSYELYQDISYKEVIFNLFRKNKKETKSRFTALSNISFDIKEGESIGIIGRNGSGKSTTLGLIAGVMIPNSGKVIVNKPVSPLLELGGGFHPDLNAYENIELNGVLLGISLKKVKEKIDNIIEFAELGEFAKQPIHMYSSGMLARLGFSIVTQLEPELLLIDEVLAVGDERFRMKCLELMQTFKARGVTIVLVSHNSEDIKTLCDRVIWLDDHRIKMDGKCGDVLEAYHAFMKN
jgi:lipopolysaccharide transport system ATP-binding protein